MGRAGTQRGSAASPATPTAWPRSSRSSSAPKDPVKLSLLTLDESVTPRTATPERVRLPRVAARPPAAARSRYRPSPTSTPRGGRDLRAQPLQRADFPEQVAFASASGARRLGHRRSGRVPGPQRLAAPAGRAPSAPARGPFGAGLDPCAALHLRLELGPGESQSVAFALGRGRDRQQAEELCRPLLVPGRGSRRPGPRRSASGTTSWATIEVKTPDDSFDVRR